MSVNKAKMIMMRNLRHHLRIPADMEVLVTTRDGQIHEVSVNDISRNGIMLSTDRKILEDLLPPAAPFSTQQLIEASVCFHLPLQNGGLTFEADGTIVYTRRLSRDVYHIGLEFKGLTDEQNRLLDDYIAENKTCAYRNTTSYK